MGEPKGTHLWYERERPRLLLVNASFRQYSRPFFAPICSKIVSSREISQWARAFGAKMRTIAFSLPLTWPTGMGGPLA